LLGHSFGGQMIGLSEEFHRLNAAILVCSQFGQTRHWDGFQRFKVGLFWYLILPLAAAVFKIVPGWTGIGEAIPRGVAREWARWGRTRDWLLPYHERAASLYAAFDRPIRAYATTDDPIAPPRAVSALLSRFRATKVERIDVRPSDLGLRSLGHLGLFRPGPTEQVWQEILEFGSRHSSPR
jgi:predicted alpha/beta hydrolase